MRVNDIFVANIVYNDENNIPIEIAKLHEPLKYLQLKIGESKFDLEVDEVTDETIVLKPCLNIKMDVDSCFYRNKKGKMLNFTELCQENLKED